MGKIKEFAENQKTFMLLILMSGIMCFVSPYFMTYDNILNIFMQSSIYGIMACGMTLAIISGDFDLSVGSVMAFAGLAVILLEVKTGLVFSVGLAVLISGVIGAVNGFFIAKLQLSSFIVTIGMSQLIKGVALRISDGKPVASGNEIFNGIGNSSLAGIPVLILFLVIFVITTGYMLKYTIYGRNIYTIGGNKEVAHNSGILVVKNRIYVFIFCSMCAGIAGILNASRLNTAAATYGDSAALNVITGVVIGGTSLAGGIGGIGKSIVGILFFNVMTNALDLLGVYSYYQTMIRGVLLIIIIAVGAYSKQRG